MNNRSLHKNPVTGKTRFNREVDARACESSLWVALVCAQRAGLDVVDDLARLHQRAGDARRAVEAADHSGAAA